MDFDNNKDRILKSSSDAEGGKSKAFKNYFAKASEVESVKRYFYLLSI